MELPGNTADDANACITSLIVRELLKRPGLVNQVVIDNAINFLLQCASSSNNGCYNFYPGHSSAENLPRLPDDADDTALVTLNLLQTGQLSKHSLIRNTCVALDRHRVLTTDHFDPPWILKGSFYTWFDKTKNVNVVDCCVNANVVALYSYAGLQHWRGYAEACDLISNAVDWAGQSAKRLAAISPFYASPHELYYAVEYAVHMGAITLTPTLKLLDWLKTENKIFEPGRAICCSAYGHVKWYCPLLQQLRAIG